MGLDRKTNDVLRGINKALPKSLQKDLTKKVVDTSGEEMARSALSSSHVSDKHKRNIKGMLESGSLRIEEEVLDDEKTAKIDRHHSRQIKRAIKEGRLADPRSDPFFAKREQRLRTGNIKKSPGMREDQKRDAAVAMQERLKETIAKEQERRKKMII